MGTVHMTTAALRILILSVLCMHTTDTPAQWSSDPAVNKAICTAIRSQSSPVITSTGAGSAVIAWDDLRRDGTFPEVFLQKLSSTGHTQWTPDGTTVSTTMLTGFSPQIIPDGAGGVICTWNGVATAGFDIFAQRIDASGSALWGPDGIPVCTNIAEQRSPQIVSDGSGGAIITWQDNRSGITDIYAQRINGSGQVQWALDGAAVCTDLFVQQSPQLVSDGAGGAIICWGDARFSGGGTAILDVFAQKVNSNGVPQWTPNGVDVNFEAANVIDICSDAAGGAIVTWNFAGSGFPIPGSSPVYAQRISSAGARAWNPEVRVSTRPTGAAPTIVEDGAGGAIIAYEQADSSISVRSVGAQRLGPAGNPLWALAGVEVSSLPLAFHRAPQVISAGGGAGIVCWQDDRNDSANVFAQKLSAAGAAEWTLNGVAVSTAAGAQQLPKLTGDGDSGAIITWNDGRGADSDIYAARIEQSGNQSGIDWSIVGEMERE